MSTDAARLKAYRLTMKTLTIAIAEFLGRLDAEMKGPSNAERGKHIAKLANALEMANDRARHFVLGEKFPLKRFKPAAHPAPKED